MRTAALGLVVLALAAGPLAGCSQAPASFADAAPVAGATGAGGSDVGRRAAAIAAKAGSSTVVHAEIWHDAASGGATAADGLLLETVAKGRSTRLQVIGDAAPAAPTSDALAPGRTPAPLDSLDLPGVADRFAKHLEAHPCAGSARLQVWPTPGGAVLQQAWCLAKGRSMATGAWLGADELAAVPDPLAADGIAAVLTEAAATAPGGKVSRITLSTLGVGPRLVGWDYPPDADLAGRYCGAGGVWVRPDYSTTAWTPAAACPSSAPTAAPAPGPTFAAKDVTAQSVADALATVRATAGDLTKAGVSIELRSGAPALVVLPTGGRPEISHPLG